MLGLLLAGSVAAQPRLPTPFNPPLPETPFGMSPFIPETPAGPTVVAVELRLPEGGEAAGLAEQVAVRKGQVLSLREVRRSVERLWSSGRFSDIVVRSVDEPPGVRVVFELTPMQSIQRITLEGNAVLRDEALRKVLAEQGLAVGERLDEDSLSGALAQVSRAYGRQGYNEARVELTQKPFAGGVELVLTLTEGQPTQVAAVSVAGGPGLPLSELLATLGLRVGGVLDRGGLESGLARLRKLLLERGYWRARVGQPLIEGEGLAATVVIPLSAGPRLSFHFHGNHHFADAVLQRVLDYDGTEPLDASTVARLARRVESFYRYRSFYDVHVETREVERPDGEEAVIAFDVEEGSPLRVRRVVFRGNVELSTETLRDMLTEHVRAATPQPGTPPRLRSVEEMGPEHLRGEPTEWVYDPATTFVEEAYREAAEEMTEAYHERGFLEAQVHFSRLRLNLPRRTAVAWFDVHEGAQMRVAEVRLVGSPQDLESQRLIPIRPGEPLSPEAMERGRRELVTALGHQGYLFARVDVEPTPTPKGIELVYRVAPGPRVTVGHIFVSGAVRTSEEVVRSTVRLREGEVLDPEKLFDSQRRLALLNIFRQVTVRMEKPDTAETIKDVLVEVHERPRWEGEVAGGYFLSEGPRVVLDVTRSNVDGRGLNLSGRLKLNYVGWSTQGLEKAALTQTTCAAAPEQCPVSSPYGWVSDFGGRAVLSAVQPRLYGLLPLEVGAHLDLIAERVHRPSYLSSRIAAATGLDWSATRWLSLTLQYEIEGNLLQAGDLTLLTPTREDQERLRFPYGFFILHSLRSSASVDLRDDPANPHRGLLVTTSAELMRDIRSYETTRQGDPIAALPINGLKVSGNVSVYAPLSSRVVLALSLRGGTIVPLEENARVIGSKRFFLGGSSSLRGFREDGVVGEDRRAELHQQLTDCRSLIHPAGCSAELLTVLGGQPPTSEGGELFTLAKAELRIPVRPSFDLGLFLEAGNLWLDRTHYQPLALRYSVGTGFRYITPVGPLAFDVGVNLDPDQTLNEPIGQIHFSIGAF